MTWDDLEEFKDDMRSKPVATITHRKSIVLNSGFVSQAGSSVGSNEYVQLMFSPQNKAIAFNFVSDGTLPGASKLVRGTNYQISAASFLNVAIPRMGFKEDEVIGKYDLQEVEIPEKGKMWVIFLGKKMDS